MTTDPAFSYPILICRDFEHLLRREGEEVDVTELAATALRRGRVLLQSPGGTGKTWTLRRVKASADTDGIPCSVLDLSSQPLPDIDLSRPENLFALAQPPITEDLPDGEPILLLVDGLAEVARQLAAGVLEAVDQWAAGFPHCGAIVADRMTRREVDERRWTLATLGPVPKEDIRTVLGREITEDEISLLSTPIFLSFASRTGSAQTSSELVSRELERAALDGGAMRALADFALNNYATYRRRPFLDRSLLEAVGTQVVDRLMEAELLATADIESSTFSHHLIHDYLAATGAAGRPEAWDGELFDALTLSNSSPESLLFLLEQTPVQLRRRLIRSVYDWNLYAAAFLLSTDQQARGSVDAVTEHQILALLGERQFDHFVASRRQVTDALVLHGGPVAERYLAAETPLSVIDAASSYLPDNPEYQAWLVLFACQEQPAPSFVLDRLDDADGVDGWTAANVVRRLGLDDIGVLRLAELSNSVDAVVRWRSVHALGVAKSNPKAVNILFSALTTDPTVSVRYGALRSIVDQAYLATTSDFRSAVFTRLASNEQALRERPSLAAEFARVLEVDAPPEDWADTASVVIAALLANETNPERLDGWREVNAGLRAARGRDD